MPANRIHSPSQAGREAATVTQAADSQDFQMGPVIGISFAHGTNDTYTSFLAPLLPALIEKLALSNSQAGLLAFLQSSPSLLQPIIGHLSDRADLRYLVIFAPAVVATIMSSLGMAPRYGVVALLVMVAGLSSASLHAVAPAIAGRLAGRRLGRAMSFWMVGGTLGFTVGPIVVSGTVSLLGLEGTRWLMVGGWLASGVLFVYLRPVSVPNPATEARGSLRVGVLALRPLLAPVGGITVMRALMVAATFIFLPTYLTGQGASLWLAGLSVSITAGAGVIGALLGGSLSERWSRRAVLSTFLVMPPLLLLALLAAKGWVLLAVLVALGITMAPTQVVLMAVVQEHSPDHRALASGLYLSVAFISESVGALALGALGDLVGLPLAYASSAVVILLSLPLVLLLPKG